MILSTLTIAILATVLSAQSAWSLKNGLALTPPMGWLNWERFTCSVNCAEFPDDCINHVLFKSMAKRLVEDGYKDVGYSYVNIDDCWSKMERDQSTGELVPDPERFPEGLSGVANYIHDLGLKIGTYGDCGTQTCAGYPAQLASKNSLEGNHYEVDAKSLSSWGIDSFKFDGCNVDNDHVERLCPKFAEVLAKQSRPILLTCEWPFYMFRENKTVNLGLAHQSCNVIRLYEDVVDSWQSVLNIVDFVVSKQDQLAPHHGPGGWWDPDMLVIGNFGLSFEQAQAQMALWCAWSAPLFMSNDLRDINPTMGAILKNKHLIEVDQDPLGVLAKMVKQDDKYRDTSLAQAFVKPVRKINNGCPSFAIVYLNRQLLGTTRRVSFKLRDLLRDSYLELAAERYASIYGSQAPEGKFDASSCRKRLGIGAPGSGESPTGSGAAANQTTGDSSIIYSVFDLFRGREIMTMGLDDNLVLDVNPSGVRAVKLIEL